MGNLIEASNELIREADNEAKSVAEILQKYAAIGPMHPRGRGGLRGRGGGGRGAKSMLDENFLQFLEENSEILVEEYWQSKRGTLVIYNVPTLWKEVSVEFLIQKFKNILNQFPNVARYQIRAGLIVKDNNLLPSNNAFTYLYPSHNFCLTQTTFHFHSSTDAKTSIERLRKALEGFTENTFLDKIKNAIAASSLNTLALISNIEYYLILK